MIFSNPFFGGLKPMIFSFRIGHPKKTRVPQKGEPTSSDGLCFYEATYEATRGLELLLQISPLKQFSNQPFGPLQYPPVIFHIAIEAMAQSKSLIYPWIAWWIFPSFFVLVLPGRVNQTPLEDPPNSMGISDGTWKRCSKKAMPCTTKCAWNGQANLWWYLRNSAENGI